MLTSEQQEQFKENGWLKIKGFFSEDEVQVIKRKITDFRTISEDSQKPLIYFEKKDKQTMVTRVENFLEHDKDVLEILDANKVKNLLKKIAGSDVFLFKDKVIYKDPGSKGFIPHQDANFGWTAFGSGVFYNLFIAIDPATSDNGPLEVAEGMHKEGRLGEQWFLLEEKDWTQFSFKPILADPGDVVLFDGWLPHKSDANTSSNSRNAIYLTYNPSIYGSKREQYFDTIPKVRRRFIMNLIKQSFVRKT